MYMEVEIVLLLVFICPCQHSAVVLTNWHYDGDNIANMKPAWQSPATYCDTPPTGTRTCYGAYLAVDNNTNENFVNGSCTHTIGNNSIEASWTVNLQRSYNISGIVIYNRKKVRDRLQHFQIYGDTFLVHNSSGTEEYNKAIIHVPLPGTRSFSNITIKLPGNNVQTDNGMNGMSYLTLCEVKIYAARRPGCIASTTDISYGNSNIYQTTGRLLDGLYTFGTILRIQCYGNFLLNGSQFMECLHTGLYNTSAPTCLDGCTVTKNPPNGHVVLPSPIYTVGQPLSVTCDKGYETNKPTVCKSGGKWEGPSPTCQPVVCPPLEQPKNGYYMRYDQDIIYQHLPRLPFRTVVIGLCDTGYESTDYQNRTCQSNRSWSGTETVCKPVVCPRPGSISNGFYKNGSKQVTLSKFPYQTVLFALCKEGYTINGPTERKCESNRTWSGSEPYCNIVTCSFPGNFRNGHYAIGRNHFITEKDKQTPYIQGHLNFSSEITAICDNGYILSSNDRRRCNASGVWTGAIPVCSPVKCGWPVLFENGHYEASRDPTADGMPYNTTLTAICDDMYQLLDSYQPRRCNEKAVWEEEKVTCKHEQTSSNAAVIGGSLAAVGVVVVLVVLTLLFYRRRKASKGKKETSLKYSDIRKKAQEHKSSANTQIYEYADIHEINMRTDRSQNGNSSQFGVYNYSTTEHQGIPAIASSSSIQSDRAYYSFSDTEKLPTTAIKLTDLSDLILTGPDAKERFRKQFEGLPQGMVKGHKEALKPKNRGKNRYKNLYAYDDTRVVLEVENKTESDYINACFVHGFSKMRKFIASQGPTAEILDDFWKMIWQTECCKIVMLTNLKEEGKVKCEQYWPYQGSHTYGRIRVSIKNTELFSQFVIRTLKMQKDDSPEKTVTQFHFTAWPDRGVPNYASSIVQFLSKVNNAPTSGKGPIVVHCSAGVGRTGTFIALDNASEQGKAVGYIDVAGVVESLRKQRVSSVQTQDQYIFVYQAVAEALMLSTAALSAATFPQAFQELLQTDPRKKKRKICLEFEALKKMSPVAEECQYVSSKLVRNRRKNRYSNVLPIEEFMPSLANEDGSEEAEYINAVFLPIKKYMQYFDQSYKEKKAFIITQTPMESTMEDFWRLVWEHDIHTMIMMNSKKEMTSSEEYWPNDSETITFGNITITNDGAEETYKHKVLSLTVKKFIVTRKVRLIQCGGWNSKKSLPESPDKILSAMELVQSWQRQTGNHTVLVHCMNGVDKSGLFCVISAVIERMKIEQDVAISHVIEEMRNAREQIIPSVEQFQFCHEAVLEFIHQYDTYSNFTA